MTAKWATGRMALQAPLSTTPWTGWTSFWNRKTKARSRPTLSSISLWSTIYNSPGQRWERENMTSYTKSSLRIKTTGNPSSKDLTTNCKSWKTSWILLKPQIKNRSSRWSHKQQQMVKILKMLPLNMKAFLNENYFKISQNCLMSSKSSSSLLCKLTRNWSMSSARGQIWNWACHLATPNLVLNSKYHQYYSIYSLPFNTFCTILEYAIYMVTKISSYQTSKQSCK